MLGIFEESTHRPVCQLIAGTFDKVLKLSVRGHWSGVAVTDLMVG